MKKSTLYLFILIVFGAVLFFSNMGGWDLWNPDEPRYAQIAKEMLDGGGWIIPHLNSTVYYDKPPLFFWLIGLAAKGLGGMSETAARFPSAFFGLSTLLLVFVFGKRLFGQRAGFFSAFILATSGEFFWLARRANIDVTLTLFTTLAIFFFYVGYQNDRWRALHCALGYGAIACGFLAKLQPAAIVPLLAIGGYFLSTRRFNFFKDKAHIPGICLFSAIIGGWLYLSYLRGGGEYLFGLLFKKTALTFFETSGHQRPFYYYFLNFPADFLPWSLFLPSAIIYGLKRAEKGKMAFLLIWCSSVLVFFSFASAKRELYILPIYPAAALIVGKLWADLVHEEGEVRLISRPLFLLLLIFLVVGIASPFLVVKFGHRYLSNALEIGVFSAAILIGGSLLAFFSYRANRKALAFFVIVSIMSSFGIYGAVRIFPQINAYKSARPLSHVIAKAMKPDDQLAVYRFEGADFNYYTGCKRIKRIEEEEALKEFLRSPLRALAVLREKDYKGLKKDFPLQIYLIERGRVGHRDLVIISNRLLKY
jgi:4-amino-4-deoxy-L-arabinose transferase-like glycosyltransferase